MAPDSIVTAFGSVLALHLQTAAPPLPTQIADTTVAVRDSAGITRPASLYAISSQQLSYIMPSGTASGSATVTVLGPNNSVSSGMVAVAPLAPGLFSADATGKGLAAANVLYYHADGTQTVTTAETPINLSNTSDQVFLVLYGTGLRNRSSLAAVRVQVGGSALPALYAGAQPQFPGLDQVNVQLPPSLAGSGSINVIVTLDGAAANTLSIKVL